jgi:hypothetical protein
MFIIIILFNILNFVVRIALADAVLFAMIIFIILVSTSILMLFGTVISWINLPLLLSLSSSLFENSFNIFHFIIK